MSSIPQSEFEEELSKQLLKAFGDGTDDDTPEQDDSQEASQETSQTEQSKPSSVRDVLSKEGFEISELSDEDLASQIAARLKSQEEAEHRARIAEEAYAKLQAELKGKSPETKQEAPAKQETAQQTLKRWAKIEIDRDLELMAERGADGLYQPKAKFGLHGIEAAQKLNEAVREQQRRANLILSDPIAALDEVGYRDQIEDAISKKLADFKASLEAEFQKRQEEEAQKRQVEVAEKEGVSFYEQHKSELFKLDANNKPLIGLDQQAVLTDFGKAVKNRIEYFNKSGITDPRLSLKLAYETEKERQSTAPVQAQATAEDKKKSFLDKGRGNQGGRAKASVAVSASDIQAPKRFLDMVLEDPENAEYLGDQYRGQ